MSEYSECKICGRYQSDCEEMSLTHDFDPKPSETEGVREWRVTQDTDNNESLNWVAGEYVSKDAVFDKLQQELAEAREIINDQKVQQLETSDLLSLARREVEELKSVLEGVEEQAKKNSEYDEWKLTQERARIVELEQKLGEKHAAFERLSSLCNQETIRLCEEVKELLSALEKIANTGRMNDYEADSRRIAREVLKKHNSGKGG